MNVLAHITFPLTIGCGLFLVDCCLIRCPILSRLCRMRYIRLLLCAKAQLKTKGISLQRLTAKELHGRLSDCESTLGFSSMRDKESIESILSRKSPP
jgi:hypothetical protein